MLVRLKALLPWFKNEVLIAIEFCLTEPLVRMASNILKLRVNAL
jgi:hypothetical protein